MELRTKIKVASNEGFMSLNSKFVTLGSCFSNVIGDFFERHKMLVKNNVFGTVYNIASVSKLLKNTINTSLISDARVVERDGLFFHLDYHSDFRNKNREELINGLKNEHLQLKDFLEKADWLIITLGTSWVYEREEEVVSNCHKLPSANFTKKLLTYEKQIEILKEMISLLQSFNPTLKLMFTVSPVRHIKDGITENSLSKSILRMLTEYAVKNYKNTFYFPSYEIMMDDLRDYRFYKEDLIHPTLQAESYIVEQFKKAYFLEEEVLILEKWDKILAALNHRPFNTESESHQAFLLNLHKKIDSFAAYFDVKEELENVSRQLKEN